MQEAEGSRLEREVQKFDATSIHYVKFSTLELSGTLFSLVILTEEEPTSWQIREYKNKGDLLVNSKLCHIINLDKLN